MSINRTCSDIEKCTCLDLSTGTAFVKLDLETIGTMFNSPGMQDSNRMKHHKQEQCQALCKTEGEEIAVED